MPEDNQVLKGEQIWEAGDREIISTFHDLLFPCGSLKECLPRNISARCAEVWNGHHVAYRCLTCGISPSSCICVACFNAGDHEGHDYFIYRSDYGGCCDCGDADAWDVCGFCRYHRMAYEANRRNPCTNLPPKIKNTLRNILPIQLKRLCHHLQAWSENETGEIPQDCKEHILFLLKLAQAHDGLRYIISEGFSNEIYEGKSILEFALRIGSPNLAKETELTNLFLDLMFDACFKRTFARIFLKLYPDLILNRAEVKPIAEDSEEDTVSIGADPTSLDRVTVQLFSIRAITLELLEDPNVQLLQTLLSTTKALLVLATDRESPVRYLVNNHSILTKRSYFQCTHDLRFVLDHQEVVDELFARRTFRECLWNGWLEIWKLIQCANPHVRIQEGDDHVQHENPKWGNSLVFESDIHSASSSMIVTLENRVMAKDVVNWALIPLYKNLKEWIDSIRSQEQYWYATLVKPDSDVNPDIAKFTPADSEENGKVACDYIVSKQGVSFHIPMHRIFASLLHCVCSSPHKRAIVKEKPSDASWSHIGKRDIKSRDAVTGLNILGNDPCSSSEPSHCEETNNNSPNNESYFPTLPTLASVAEGSVLDDQSVPSRGMTSSSGVNAGPKRSSYLARLEDGPVKDVFEGEYQLFDSTAQLFSTVMGGEQPMNSVDPVALLHVMEHPLRCLVFHAQCYGFSSLWLRNGDSVAYEACFYKKNYWHSLFVDPDLTLIRLVMLALAENNHLSSFVSTVLQRFESGPKLTGHSVETLLLTLCQCLAVEPYTFKANDIERITEYHCIHVLAKGPCTHSELTDTIMKSHDNSDFLDGILNQIADFQEPDANPNRSPGKYTLKAPLWKHVDTLFLLYSWKEQHEVEERKMEKLGPKLANTYVLHRHLKEVEPYVVPCYRKGLRKLAREPSFFSIALVSMLQSYISPLEKINHRALQLSLLLIQRFIILCDKDDVPSPIPQREMDCTSTEAENVFAIAGKISDMLFREGNEKKMEVQSVGSSVKDDNGSGDWENHNTNSVSSIRNATFTAPAAAKNDKEMQMVELFNLTTNIDDIEVAPNCLARGSSARDDVEKSQSKEEEKIVMNLKFSLLSVLESILAEPSCKQHVAVVNQNLVLLQMYGLYTPSERKRRETAVEKFYAKQNAGLMTTSSTVSGTPTAAGTSLASNSTFGETNSLVTVELTSNASSGGISSVDAMNSLNNLSENSKLKRWDSAASQLTQVSIDSVFSVNGETDQLASVTSLTGGTDEKSEAELKKEARKKKQAAMLKKFNQKQKNFLTEAGANQKTLTPAKTPPASASATSTAATPSASRASAAARASAAEASPAVVEATGIPRPAFLKREQTSQPPATPTSGRIKPICPEVNDDPDMIQESECVICFCTHPGEETGSNPLGRMANMQKSCVSNVPRLKKRSLIGNASPRNRRSPKKKGSPSQSRKRKRNGSPIKNTMSQESQSDQIDSSKPFGLPFMITGAAVPASVSENATSTANASTNADSDAFLTAGSGSAHESCVENFSSGESKEKAVATREASPPSSADDDSQEGNLCSSESSSCGTLEDPNLKRREGNFVLIEELEVDPPSAGIYVWSCGHKIHWECWRRLRHGAVGSSIHCPYCNHPVHTFIPEVTKTLAGAIGQKALEKYCKAKGQKKSGLVSMIKSGVQGGPGTVLKKLASRFNASDASSSNNDASDLNEKNKNNNLNHPGGSNPEGQITAFEDVALKTDNAGDDTPGGINPAFVKESPGPVILDATSEGKPDVLNSSTDVAIPKIFDYMSTTRNLFCSPHAVLPVIHERVNLKQVASDLSKWDIAVTNDHLFEAMKSCQASSIIPQRMQKMSMIPFLSFVDCIQNARHNIKPHYVLIPPCRESYKNASRFRFGQNIPRGATHATRRNFVQTLRQGIQAAGRQRPINWGNAGSTANNQGGGATSGQEGIPSSLSQALGLTSTTHSGGTAQTIQTTTAARATMFGAPSTHRSTDPTWHQQVSDFLTPVVQNTETTSSTGFLANALSSIFTPEAGALSSSNQSTVNNSLNGSGSGSIFGGQTNNTGSIFKNTNTNRSAFVPINFMGWSSQQQQQDAATNANALNNANRGIFFQGTSGTNEGAESNAGTPGNGTASDANTNSASSGSNPLAHIVPPSYPPPVQYSQDGTSPAAASSWTTGDGEQQPKRLRVDTAGGASSSSTAPPGSAGNTGGMMASRFSNSIMGDASQRPHTSATVGSTGIWAALENGSTSSSNGAARPLTAPQQHSTTDGVEHSLYTAESRSESSPQNSSPGFSSPESMFRESADLADNRLSLNTVQNGVTEMRQQLHELQMMTTSLQNRIHALNGNVAAVGAALPGLMNNSNAAENAQQVSASRLLERLLSTGGLTFGANNATGSPGTGAGADLFGAVNGNNANAQAGNTAEMRNFRNFLSAMGTFSNQHQQSPASGVMAALNSQFMRNMNDFPGQFPQQSGVTSPSISSPSVSGTAYDDSSNVQSARSTNSKRTLPSDMLRLAMRAMSSHPANVLNGLFADQIRMDEIRLRSLSQHNLESKRIDTIRAFATAIRAFSSSYTPCDAEVKEFRKQTVNLPWTGPDMLVMRMMSSLVPCDPAVLHEWVTFASVLSEALAEKAQTIALLHTIKLIFHVLETEFAFLKLPTVCPLFQTAKKEIPFSRRSVHYEDKKRLVKPPKGKETMESGPSSVPMTPTTTKKANLPSKVSGVTPRMASPVLGSTVSSNVEMMNKSDIMSDVTPLKESPGLEDPSKPSLSKGELSKILSKLQENTDTVHEEDEDIFELFDQEDKVVREELRKEKNELRRSAEVFDVTPDNVKHIVAVGLLPLLRRLCLLRRVLNDVDLPFEAIANSLNLAEDVKTLPPGDDDTNSPAPKTYSSVTSPWEHASTLARHLGHDLDAIFNWDPVQDPILNDILVKLDMSLDRHLSKQKSQGRTFVEFMPTLNQKSKVERENSTMMMSGSSPAAKAVTHSLKQIMGEKDAHSRLTQLSKMPYIRPKFAKRSTFIRLSAQNDTFSKYPDLRLEKDKTHTRPCSVIIENKVFFLEFHLLGFGKTEFGSHSTNSRFAITNSSSSSQGACPGSPTMANSLAIDTVSTAGLSPKSRLKAAQPFLQYNHSGGVLVRLPFLFQTLYTTYIHEQCPFCFPLKKDASKHCPPADDEGRNDDAASNSRSGGTSGVGNMFEGLTTEQQTYYFQNYGEGAAGSSGDGASSSEEIHSPTSMSNEHHHHTNSRINDVNYPKISFLCLLSGKHLCSSNTFLENQAISHGVGGGHQNCPNSFTKHSAKCGMNISVLMNLLSGLVHIQKDDRICVWGAIYLDAYGEEDRYLSRGKPLYLSQTRLQQLTNALATHSFDSDSKLSWKTIM